MSSVKYDLDRVFNIVNNDMPQISLKAGESFKWSPHSRTITYKSDALDSSVGIWSLLHEIAHAKLGHAAYETDFDLLLLEVEAWEEAKHLSNRFNEVIDEEHIQDCLDTYRDWLHLMSTCPTCGIVGLQKSLSEYRCHNCYTTWQVSESRFCRAYRRKAL